MFFEIKLSAIHWACRTECKNDSDISCNLLKSLKEPAVDLYFEYNKILNTDGTGVGWDFQIINRKHVKSMFTTPYAYQNFKSNIQARPYNFNIHTRTLGQTICNKTNVKN